MVYVSGGADGLPPGSMRREGTEAASLRLSCAAAERMVDCLEEIA